MFKDGLSLAGYSTNESSSGVPEHPSLKFIGPDFFANLIPKIARVPTQIDSVLLEPVLPSSQEMEPNLSPSQLASARLTSGCKGPVPLLVGAATDAVSGGERPDGLVGILLKPQVDRDELTWQQFLGSGVTAEVFKGRWRGRDVAIKRLLSKKHRVSQTKQEVAFVREIDVVAQANHDNLVKFFGFHFDAQPFLLITEFCHGGTCFELLHEADLELVIDQQLKMCSDVASGMDYLHKFRPQIIHRDLKSLNLLLAQVVSTTSDVPHVKVADFGVARMKDEDGDWGEMTAAAGSYHWMAPEVVTGHYDEKADVYSFAMVLFEIICQEIPFEELEANDVIKRTSKGARPDMEAVPPTTPDALVEIMEQSWAQDSKARPSFETICRTLSTIVREIYA